MGPWKPREEYKSDHVKDCCQGESDEQVRPDHGFDFGKVTGDPGQSCLGRVMESKP